MANDETKVTQDDVWTEHLADVRVGPHWAYLAAVIVGGFLLMVTLIAVLGSTTG
jgi:hypothetical protein